MDLVEIQKRLRGYRLERELGRGGMGVVFQAFQDSQQRRVALKIVSTDQNDGRERAARFAQEARLAARIRHLNVVRMIDFDVLGGVWMMIAFELVEGESLRSLLERESPLAPQRACEIGAGLAAGLGAIHAAGILHRDLKPENVMLSEQGPKITDLGIAKDLVAGRLKTSSGLILGTPPYLSPEQIHGTKPLTGAVDVYALGCVLFEMVTGRLPFEEAVLTELLLAHVNRPPPDPREFRGDVPPELSKLILSCLAKRPGDRPKTAELVARLAPADADADPHAPPPARATPGRSDAGASSIGVTVVVKPGAMGKPTAEPTRRRGWRTGALAIGAALAVLALFARPAPPRGHLALPAQTISRAAVELDRTRRAARAALVQRLRQHLADPLAGDLRVLCQSMSDKSNRTPDAPPNDPVFAFWSNVERAAAVQALVHRASDVAAVLLERYRPAELGLDDLRLVADGLVLRVELDRVWTTLLDEGALIDAIAERKPLLARIAATLKRPEPPRLAPDMKVIRSLHFNASAPPVEQALRALFQELELADAQQLPEFERYQTCWRALAFMEDVSTVDCSSETVQAPFVDRVRPPSEALRRDPWLAALVAALEACRNPHFGFAGAAIAFGKALPRSGPYPSPLWQSVTDLSRILPFPFSLPRELERRPRM